MSICINPPCANHDNLDSEQFCQKCQSVLLIGGRYRVTSLLGEGGFAKTYEVFDSFDSTDKKVLKVLTKKKDKAIELFNREAKVLKELNHPGIPKGEENFIFIPKDSPEKLHCLIMEKIEGCNLQEWLEGQNNNPIHEELAVQWLKQLAYILDEIHQKDVFHRDINPSNIMLKPNGQLVLIDFGISREVDEAYHQQVAAQKVTKEHTSGYAPLEQELGQATPQSDFFALGRTFVYLLTGKDPEDMCSSNYRNPNTDEDWQWRNETSGISKPLLDFIDKLMSKAAKNRPADTKELLNKIEELETQLFPKEIKIQATQPPIFPAKVVSIDSNWMRLVINRGTNQRIRIGQKFIVYSEGENLSDLNTGEFLEKEEIFKGIGKVIHVQNNISTLESDKTTTKIIRHNRSAIWGGGEETETHIVQMPFEYPQIGDLVKPI